MIRVNHASSNCSLEVTIAVLEALYLIWPPKRSQSTAICITPSPPYHFCSMQDHAEILEEQHCIGERKGCVLYMRETLLAQISS